MKNFGGKFLVVFAFLVISLLAANAFIINSDFKGGFEPRLAKSILNYSRNENSFVENDKNDINKNANVYPERESEENGSDDDVANEENKNRTKKEDKDPKDGKSVVASRPVGAGKGGLPLAGYGGGGA